MGRHKKINDNDIKQPKSIEGVLWSDRGWFHINELGTFYKTHIECALKVHGALKKENNVKKEI